MVQRVKRWLGLGSPPAVGIEFRNDGAYVALVRPAATVVGVGHVPLPPGSVVDGQIRRPAETAAIVNDALAAIHWRRKPSIRVAIPPETWTGVTAPGIVTTAVRDATGINGSDRRTALEIGTLAVAEPIFSSTLGTVQSMAGRARGIEPSPVSIARFLRLSQPGLPLRFARLTEPDRRWTMCDAVGSFEVEVRPQGGGVPHLASGPNQARMEAVGWGSVRAESAVTARVPQPEPFTAAVGAALGEFMPDLSGNLLESRSS